MYDHLAIDVAYTDNWESGHVTRHQLDVPDSTLLEWVSDAAGAVALLCRWLEQAFNAYLGDQVVTATAIAGAPGARRNALTTNFGAESAMRGFGAELTRIIKTELIARRAGSFNSTGMLFR